MTSRSVLHTTAMLAMSAASAMAATYDGFDYATGSALLGASGGTGFVNSWGASGTDANETQIVRAGSLDGGSLPSSGGYLELASTGSNNNSNASRQLYSSNKSTGTYYFSVIMQPESGNSTSFGYLQLNDSNSNVPVRVGYSAGGNWYVRSPYNGNAQTNSTVASANGTSALLVAKVDLDANIADLWVNPSGTSLATPDASVNMGASSYIRFDRMSLRAGSSSSTGTTMASFDEIRFGTELGDVMAVPEPAAMALLAGATCLLGVRRKSR